jgi:hypothetical protein
MKNILEEWGFTIEEFTHLVRDNPSLRGVLIGYIAELKLQSMWLSSEEITASSKPDDHDRKRKGDRVTTYRDHQFILESKSLQTSTVTQTDSGFLGKAQVDASDRRIIELPNGHKLNTTLLLKGEFDILAVNIYAFEATWRFVFAKNEDLPTSRYRKYDPEDARYLIASLIPVTWPPRPPFRDEPFSLMNEIIREREQTKGEPPKIAIIEEPGKRPVAVDTEHPRPPKKL